MFFTYYANVLFIEFDVLSLAELFRLFAYTSYVGTIELTIRNINATFRIIINDVDLFITLYNSTI